VYRVKPDDSVERADVVLGAAAPAWWNRQGLKPASASWSMAPASCARA
jgi:hypothetical protein